MKTTKTTRNNVVVVEVCIYELILLFFYELILLRDHQKNIFKMWSIMRRDH